MAATNAGVRELTMEQRLVVEAWLLEFDQAWHANRLAARVRELPPPGNPLRLPALMEMIKIDLERQWQQGRQVKIEDYLQAYPEWGGRDAVPVDLIQAEYQARAQAGMAWAWDEVFERFPCQAEQLRRLTAPAQEQTSRGEPAYTSAALRMGGPHHAERDDYGATAASSALPAVPGYQVLEVLGRGGMGVVYKARQQSLNRIVGLKMIRAGHEADPAQLARFHTEARAVAQLQHPNIVQIHEVGQHQGQAYFSLEFIEGGSLARKLKTMLPAPRQAAHLAETLARAIHFAHQRRIVHRDLKPGNILMTPDGVPKITDFGLAKNLEPQPGRGEPLTRSGDILGTPSYMAPEQAAGNVRAIGPGTDIHALGAILYEMLTGRAPFAGKNAMETLQNVLGTDPVPPKVPRDLQTICMTCLHKDPGRRYGTALDLADDLQAFLAGEPIRARPATTGERLLKWVLRRPTIALVLGISGVVLAGLIIGALWFSSLAFGAIALVSLLLGAGWYGARLQNALRQVRALHLQTERNVERLHLLLETTNRLMSTRGLDELLRLLSETTTRMANAERATIFLVDVDKGELWSRVAIGDDVGEIRVPLGKGIAGTVALTGEVINLANPYVDPRFNPEIDKKTGYTTRNLLTLPMVDRTGRNIGVFEVLNKRGGAFDEDDAEILGSLAASAALAVENPKRAIEVTFPGAFFPEQ